MSSSSVCANHVAPDVSHNGGAGLAMCSRRLKDRADEPITPATTTTVAEVGSRGADTDEPCAVPPAVNTGPTGLDDHYRRAS